VTTLTQLVEGLAATIRTIPNLRVTDHVPESTEYPAAFIVPPIIDYDNLDDSGGTFQFQVVLLVSTAIGRNQKQLYPWLYGPGSIQATLQANRSLGLAGVDTYASGARPLPLQDMASYGAYGAVVDVQAVLSP
jgi:single-stranded DNA-specific DHH superfamily exonuclease